MGRGALWRLAPWLTRRGLAPWLAIDRRALLVSRRASIGPHALLDAGMQALLVGRLTLLIGRRALLIGRRALLIGRWTLLIGWRAVPWWRALWVGRPALRVNRLATLWGARLCLRWVITTLWTFRIGWIIFSASACLAQLPNFFHVYVINGVGSSSRILRLRVLRTSAALWRIATLWKNIS
jgi:hypothetical protein